MQEKPMNLDYTPIIRALADPRAYDKAQREGGPCQYALLMRQYCEHEVALYLDVDLDDPRGLVEEHLPKPKQTGPETPRSKGAE
jgi:hypothetical protein